MSMMCSSQLMSWPSPVVPPTIKPPTPASICFSTSASYAARSTLPLGRYGVLIAVISRVALISSTEAVMDFIVLLVHALDATHWDGGRIGWGEHIWSVGDKSKRDRAVSRAMPGSVYASNAPWWKRLSACGCDRGGTRRPGRRTPRRPWRKPCCYVRGGADRCAVAAIPKSNTPDLTRRRFFERQSSFVSFASVHVTSGTI